MNDGCSGVWLMEVRLLTKRVALRCKIAALGFTNPRRRIGRAAQLRCQSSIGTVFASSLIFPLWFRILAEICSKRPLGTALARAVNSHVYVCSTSASGDALIPSKGLSVTRISSKLSTLHRYGESLTTSLSSDLDVAVLSRVYCCTHKDISPVYIEITGGTDSGLLYYS